MSIWNKVLIGFIFIAAAAFFYMAARSLKTHQHWRELAQKHEVKVDEVVAENVELVDGGQGEDAHEGIDKTRLAIHKLMLDRGRVWYNCEPQKVDAETGALSLATDLPDPHQITEKAVLVIFEENDISEGGRYLGQFKVTEIAEKQLAMEPAMKLSPRRLQRLSRSKGPWTLYDITPIDNHEAFAELDEEELAAMLPEASRPDYAKDGQPAEPDDPKELLAKDGKTYQRKLRDYEVLFREYDRSRAIMVDLIEAATADKQYVEAALAKSQQQEQLRQKEIADLKIELAKYVKERDAVVAHHENLKSKLAAVRASIDQHLKTNRAMAGTIAKIQLDATRIIDQRTNRMARSDVR